MSGKENVVEPSIQLLSSLDHPFIAIQSFRRLGMNYEKMKIKEWYGFLLERGNIPNHDVEMSPRSVANMSRSNSESSLLSSYVCGMVTVYQCYMVRFASGTGRPVVG